MPLPEEGRKQALLVGINAHPGSELRGCLNDVKLMYDFLTVDKKFPADNIRVLTDGRATRAAILDRIRWLVGTARPNDTLVFHFSSHGTQVRDRSGDELEDNLDEVFCPVDMDWDNPLTDDVLGQEFSKLPQGARLTIVADCCHSGTATREGMSNPDPALYRKARQLTPPLDIQLRAENRVLPVRKIARKKTIERRGTDGKLVLEDKTGKAMRHMLISGCASNETSADAYIAGTYHGALTYYLVNVAKKAPGRPFADVHQIVAKTILSSGYSQHSQLEGSPALLARELFA